MSTAAPITRVNFAHPVDFGKARSVTAWHDGRDDLKAWSPSATPAGMRFDGPAGEQTTVPWSNVVSWSTKPVAAKAVA